MSGPFEDIGLRTPIFAAPMAGGPSTSDLVGAAAVQECVGFLAAGYLTAEQTARQLAEIRARRVPFALNLFAPSPLPVEPLALASYAQSIQAEADTYGLQLSDRPVEDDDRWTEKIELLLADPVPLVSFTFAIPQRETIDVLRRAGSMVAQTVTSVTEALLAVEAGVDALVVQAACAGGHSATMTPREALSHAPLTELVALVRRSGVTLPLIAAGGLAQPADVAAVIRGGADAAMVGTVLIRSEESGASEVHKAALADPKRTQTVITRAFTGRPARGLRNRFIESHEAQAPYGYPAVHHLTSPLRKAAAIAGDPENVHLWAGTGYRHASAEPAGGILARLAEDL